jgi:thiol-disulfide isomerase/thioredoxin
LSDRKAIGKNRNPMTRSRVILLASLLASCSLACSPAATNVTASIGGDNAASDPHSAITYKYDSLDEKPVSSDAFAGKPVVLAFVTTYDIVSQAVMDYLAAMSKRDGDQVHYAMIAVQDGSDRELVEVYREHLKIDFPVAMGDAASIAGGGPFGDVHVVPTIVILNREGRVVWRHVGIAKSAEIRNAMRKL